MTLNQKLHCHPFAVRCHIEHSLVVTYAFPEKQLRPLIPESLELDCYEGCGFLAVAMVQVRKMRPAPFPEFLGRQFFMVGFRLFVRAKHADGRRLRGLYILRSLTDSRFMKVTGNSFTHYQYRLAEVQSRIDSDQIMVSVTDPEMNSRLRVDADLNSNHTALPEDSPFPDERRARLFCGPMPYTFDVPEPNGRVLAVRAERQNWHPRLVGADVESENLFNSFELPEEDSQLASCFYISDTDYHWNSGVFL